MMIKIILFITVLSSCLLGDNVSYLLRKNTRCIKHAKRCIVVHRFKMHNNIDYPLNKLQYYPIFKYKIHLTFQDTCNTNELTKRRNIEHLMTIVKYDDEYIGMVFKDGKISVNKLYQQIYKPFINSSFNPDIEARVYLEDEGRAIIYKTNDEGQLQYETKLKWEDSGFILDTIASRLTDNF